MFASSGEKLEDFDIFHPDRMASRILDMGDMLTLIEQAERAFDEEQTASMAGKLASGEGFTLEDFVEQLAMVRKLGPIGNLLGMLPGAAQNRELLSQVNDSDLDRAAAIVNSMTPQERKNPKILNGSRRARIAGGAGVAVGEVNNLVVRFLEGQKMMRQMLGGGGVPGMPAIPGMRRTAQKSVRGKKAKKKPKGGRPGGNPAAGKVPGGSGPGGSGPGGNAGGGVPGGRIEGGPLGGNAGGGVPGGRVSGGAAGLGLPGAIPGKAGAGIPGGLGALTGSPEDYAASLEALAASNPAFRVPEPDKPSGAPASPSNLPAGFGVLRRRNRQAKKDEG
jgi:signal recognition particle subunit SRP54